MKRLLLLLIPCVAFAGTEPINTNTADGKVKQTSSGTGTLSKPFNFCEVAVAGIPFLSLSDVPSSYSGQELKVVRVNSGATGLEFATGGSGGSTLAFGTISVSGQSDVVADAAPDTVTFAQGNRILITTNASTDTVTFALATATPSATYTPTPTATATATFTPTPTATATGTATSTPTPSATATATPTATAVTLTIAGNAQQINVDRTWALGHAFGFTTDGAGTVIPIGVTGYFTVHESGTITAWSITATGSSPTCTIDVWKIATGTALPTVANTIMGTKPALSTGNAIRSTNLTGWTTSFAAGDIFGFNADSVTNATKITFQIEYQK